MATSKAQDVATPVKQISMAQAGEVILNNMFYRFQGARPEMEDRLQAAYKKRFGYEMMTMLPTDEVRAVYLEGPPGNGKTMTHQWAAKEFAKMMDMRFVKNPSLNMVSSGDVGINDFVYAVIELAGETSNKEVAGLMTKMKVKMPNGETTDFMGHIQDWRLAATTMGGYAYVNYDDFPTASHQVQNAMLGTLLNGKSSNISITMNDLITADKEIDANGDQIFKLNPERAAAVRENASTVAIGLCGNRGDRDGNKTYDITTATADRVMRFDVFDTLDAFNSRTLNNKTDTTSDAGMCGFLEANKEFFFKLTMRESGMMGQSCTSRGWDALMTQMRQIVHSNGGIAGIANMNEEAQLKVQNQILTASGGIVSSEASTKLAAYYTELFVGAAPIADQIINKGIVDEARIEQKYGAGDAAGKSASTMNFGYSLASSLSAFTATALTNILKDKKDLDAFNKGGDLNTPLVKKVREVMCNFSMGINQLKQGPMRSFALDQMSRRLIANIPSLYTNNGAYRIPERQTAMVMAMGMLVDNTKYMNNSYIDDIKKTLTQQGGFEDAMSFCKDKMFSNKAKAAAP